MSTGKRRRFWVAWRHKEDRRRREWYVSVEGLRWVAWPSMPTEGDYAKVEHKLCYEPAITDVPTVGTSWLRSEGFTVVPPK